MGTELSGVIYHTRYLKIERAQIQFVVLRPKKNKTTKFNFPLII